MSSLPASMKKIRSKLKALQWSQHYTAIFSDAQGQITLVLVSVSVRNLNSSKLSCMSSLPGRMRMIDSKMKELEAANSAVLGPIWSNFELGRDVMDVSLPASMKKIRSKMKAVELSQYFPIITLWELSVAIGTRVQIRSGPKPNAAFPPPPPPQ